jgi:hypothetical protein
MYMTVQTHVTALETQRNRSSKSMTSTKFLTLSLIMYVRHSLLASNALHVLRELEDARTRASSEYLLVITNMTKYVRLS